MSFTVSTLGLSGVMLLAGRRFEDDRGYFTEVWSRDSFAALGLDTGFVQDNESLSLRRATMRGLHFQTSPFAQAKLVRVVSGAIFDVVADVRPASPTFGKWIAEELSSRDGRQLFIPKGFAHGFMTLVDNTVVAYRVDAPYAPSHDSGISWQDPDLAIRWPFNSTEVIVSAKDRALPRLRIPPHVVLQTG